MAQSAETIIANDETYLPIGSLAHTYGYDGSGNLITDTVSYNNHTYIQTFTYSGSQLTGVSLYVRQ
jgi:hypothetical protein